jgi:hypothetical protein
MMDRYCFHSLFVHTNSIDMSEKVLSFELESSQFSILYDFMETNQNKHC